MKSKLKKMWAEQPLLVIMLIALAPRLLATFFSKGYGMYDDHFVFIEYPYRILNDFSIWEKREFPQGRSVVYPAINYFIIKLCNFLGAEDPQEKMLFIRLLHAFYSLFTVFFGYKIAKIISDENNAKTVGLVLALFWIFPFMSVRNLIEMVSAPMLMAGLYYSLKSDKTSDFVLSGLFFGLAFVFRVQTILLPFGVGLAMLYRKQIKSTLVMALACLASMFIFQGLSDWYVWGYPFASFLAYFFYNASHSTDYIVGPWYRYILLITGIFLPPVGILFIYGYLRTWKKYLLLFLPILVFLVFHSYFPNKQERFILPILAPMLILSIIGWLEYVKHSRFWQNHKKLGKSIWVYFWTINSILLIIFSFTYSKKTRVESMYYFSKAENISAVLVVGGDVSNNYPPTFYMNRPEKPVYTIKEKYSNEDISELRKKAVFPNYFVFYGIESIEDRKKRLEQALGANLALVKTIEPSITDDLLYKLNPRGNKNQTGLIYKVIK